MYPPSTTTVKQFEISEFVVNPPAPDTTSPDKQIFVPIIVNVVSNPLPAGIKEPVNEKPNATVELVDNVKPFSAAAPPDALTSVTPSTLN